LIVFQTHDELGVISQRPRFVVRKTPLIAASHDATDKRCAGHGKRRGCTGKAVEMAVNKRRASGGGARGGKGVGPDEKKEEAETVDERRFRDVLTEESD
jgi:hypothetical protein